MATKSTTKPATKATIPAGNTHTSEVTQEQLDAVATKLAAEAIPNWFTDVLGMSRRRLIVSAVGWLLGYATTYYWGVTLIDYLTVALMNIGAPVFVTYLFAFMGVVVAMVIAWLAANSVFKFVAKFDLGVFADAGRGIKNRTISSTNVVRSWFRPIATEQPAR